MINLEIRANSCLEILEDYTSEIIKKESYKKIYSDTYGNLHEAIEEIKFKLENHRKAYRETARDLKDYGSQAQMDHDRARNRLNRAISDFELLWNKEILPSAESILKELPSKVEQEEIKLPPDEKSNMLEEANKTKDLLQKVASTGKKVWETVKEYKEIIFFIGKFFI